MDALQPPLTVPPIHTAGEPRWYERDDEYRAWYISACNDFWDAVNERDKEARCAKRVKGVESAQESSTPADR